MSNINHLINQYYTWLKERTICKNMNEWVEITAPYLDRNNDYIQMYLKKTKTGYLLTDDGYTIAGLKQEGCNLDSSKRQQLLQLILKGYGVKKYNSQLQITVTSEDDFPVCKHSLVQAILAVNDMFYMSSPYIQNLFFEDVRSWLDKSNIRYSERIIFPGLSNYNRNFDFIISKSSEQPERLIKTINKPTKNSADSIVMDWMDIKDGRQDGVRLYTFINNDTVNPSDFNTTESENLNTKSAIGKVCTALKQYKIQPILWSKREEIKQELVA